MARSVFKDIRFIDRDMPVYTVGLFGAVECYIQAVLLPDADAGAVRLQTANLIVGTGLPMVYTRNDDVMMVATPQSVQECKGFRPLACKRRHAVKLAL